MSNVAATLLENRSRELLLEAERKLVAEKNNTDLAAARDEIERLREALRSAYTFITQPAKMQTTTLDGRTKLTYFTHQYNEMTAQFRAALAPEKEG